VALTIQHEIFSAGSWVAGKQCDPEVTSHVTRLRKIKAAELQGKHFIKVACGESHSVALTSEGELYSWGGTRHGKLGRAVPHAAAAPSNAPSTSAFGSSAASKAAQQALKAAAEAAAAEADKPMSFKVPGALALKRVVQISCGRLHTVVSTSEGQVFSFGGNEQGQLGLPGCKESDTPKLVAGKLTNVSIRSVVCGAFFTFALSGTSSRRSHACLCRILFLYFGVTTRDSRSVRMGRWIVRTVGSWR
jgi:alpha-tubulin suppressor-like RCC1 family protein